MTSSRRERKVTFALSKIVVLRRLGLYVAAEVYVTITVANNFSSAARHKSAKAGKLAGTKPLRSLRRLNATSRCRILNISVLSRGVESKIMSSAVIVIIITCNYYCHIMLETEFRIPLLIKLFSILYSATPASTVTSSVNMKDLTRRIM